MHFRLILFFLCWHAVPAISQNGPVYPQDYFRNPLGIPMDLSANFGELRPNHWHMGLDIRTRAKENQPVYAAARGYIAKVGIRPQSFGRYIIINHPNGLSTLYGHLNEFYPELEAWVTARQYEQESWAVELDIPKEKFPLSKGSFIAYSGNTGGSQGPHLHFEIFDTKTSRRLNPLLFGFPVTDHTPPSLVKLALYDRNRSVYDQSPLFYSLKNTDSGYITAKIPVIETGCSRTSFAIQAYDRVSGSNNPNGIYSATLYFDGVPQVSFVLDSLDYEETVYMNAQVDYKFRYNGGGWLQHLSVLPGDAGRAYQRMNGDGIITLSDTSLHALRVEVRDASGNSVQLNFGLKYNDSLVRPVYRQPDAFYFIPNQETVLTKPDFQLDVATGSLYDTVKAYYSRNNSVVPANAVSAAHQVNDADMPVHAPITVRIKPFRTVPAGMENKLLIQRTYRSGRSVQKARQENGWLKAEFDDFGYFQAFFDTVPPELNNIGRGDTVNLSPAGRIVFSPADNFGIIRNFRAELNGQWLRFTNDKSRDWVYTFDDRCPYGVHELKVTVEDLVGNTTRKTWWFKREPYTPPPKKKAVKKGSTKKKVTVKGKVPVKKKR
ncbi:MAG: M23 family metallopeptidase [Sphingobacteriales bacterium]|nr:M23 family metallopeptidase [Sphingobacteriales bacterium]